MKLKPLTACSAIALMAFASGCAKQNPTSPTSTTSAASTATATNSVSSVTTITDQRTGVTIASPRPVTPLNNAQIVYSTQPVTLAVSNGFSTSGTRTYTFEVATDAAFGSIVYSKSGIAEGGSGQTSLTIDKLAGKTTYYWRARVQTAGVDGPNSTPWAFVMGPEVVIQAPVLSDPGSNATVSQNPVLTIINSQFTGPAGKIFYRFDVSTSSSFSSLIDTATVAESATGGSTSHTVTTKLDEGLYWWRVQASDPSNGVSSPYTNANPFKVAKGLDLTTAVIVLGPANIASWPQTSTITDASQVNGQLCIYHTMLGLWPTTAYFGDDSIPLEGNQWIFAFINGQWYGGANDWYKAGQACKSVDRGIAADGFSGEPLHSWIPQDGEIFGVMVSTPARAWPSMATLDQRSDVKLIQWP